MADAPEQPAVAAAVERRIVTVMFADLVGFTPLSEAMDPEDVATVQDAYFSSVRETVERYGGVLEKFIGDAAMAAFGIPRSRDDDAPRAVRAGLALIGALEQLEARLGLAPLTLQLRVGINTGEVVHAVSGPDAGRITGDTVNTAARLQAAARPGTVLCGPLTALAIAESIETAEFGSVDLKGKAEPVRTWLAIGLRPAPSRDEALGALRAPTVGREAELATLHEAAQAVASERRTDRVVIIAAPGVGKSRLLGELAARSEIPVLRARVRPQATAPYETVAQLLAAADPERLEVALSETRIPAARAAVVIDEVRRVIDPVVDGIDGSTDLAAQRDSRFDAWLAAFDALAGGPSAWLVEDVHWAGGDLLAFLDRAGRSPAPAGRLVIATARPSLLERAPRWCQTTRIDLEPLPPLVARELIAALIGDVLPDSLVDAVVERSDGNPLFIEELLRTWSSVGTLVVEHEAWRLAVPPESIALPSTVQAIYAAQLDDLPTDARAIARRGAVAGRRLPTGAFAALGLDPLGPGLDTLRRREFLSGPIDDPVTGDTYAYRHALLRDAGYASLGRAERARLHAAMAQWLIEAAADRADVVAEAIAEHYDSALGAMPGLAAPGALDRLTLMREAAAWYGRAATAALGLAAHEAARRLLRRSIELTGPDDVIDLGRRRLRLGEILAASADLDAGIGEMEAAVEAFAGDVAGTVAATSALSRGYMQQIRFEEAEELTGATLARLADAPDAVRAPLHALHAWAVSAQGREDGVAAEADRATEAVAGTGDPLLELDVLEAVNAARDEIGIATADDWARLETKALAAGRWHQVVVAGRTRGVMHADHEPRGALTHLAATAEIAATHGLTEQAGWVNYSRCEISWVVGDWDAALALGREVVEVGDRYAYERLAFRTWVVLLAIAAARGDAGLAQDWEDWWSRASAHFPATPSPYGRVLRGAIGVWVAQATSESIPLPPEDLTDAFVPFSNPHFLAAVETVTRAWLDAGRDDLARIAADRAGEHAADPSSTRLMQTSAALLAAWLTGSKADARTAADLAERHGAPWWELRARLLTGEPRAAELARHLGVGLSAPR